MPRGRPARPGGPAVLMRGELAAPEPGPGGVAGRGRRLALLLPHLALVLLLTALIAVPIGRRGLLRPPYGSGRLATALTAGVVACDYLRLLCWPWPLQTAVDYPVVGDDAPALAWLATLAIAALGIAAAVGLGRAAAGGRVGPGPRVAALAVCWFLVAWSPTSNLATAIGTLYAERYLYLPVIALGLVVGAVADWAWARRAAPGGRAALAALAAAVLAWAGVTAIRTRAWDGSEAVWTDVLAKDPAHHTASFNLAVHRFRAALELPKRPRDAALRDAERLLREALASTHRSFFTVPERAWLQLANTRSMLGRFDEAIAAADTALAAARQAVREATHAPHREARRRFQAAILAGRGQARDKAGDAARAEADFRAALDIDPAHAAARLNLGLMVARRAGGDAALLAEAEQHLREASQLNPGDPEPLLNLAVLLSQKQFLSQALQAIDAVLARDPRSPDARYYRAIVLFNAGRIDDAGQAFKGMAAEPDPAARARAAVGLARLAEAADRLGDAEQACRRALDDPLVGESVHAGLVRVHLVELYLTRANARLGADDLPGALPFLEAAAGYGSRGARNAAVKVTLQIGQGRLEKGTPDDLAAAADAFTRALGLDPTAVEAHLGLAAVARERKDLDALVAALTEALEPPGVAPERRRRVLIECAGLEAARAILIWKAGAGDLAKTREALAKAESLAPDAAVTLRAIAQIESASGEASDHDRAVAAAERLAALLRDPSPADLSLLVRVFSEAAGRAARRAREAEAPADRERRNAERLALLARAIEWQDKLLAKKTDNAGWWRNLANLRKSAGDIEGALAAYERGHALDAGDTQMRDELADLHRVLGLRLYTHWKKAPEESERLSAVAHLRRWVELASPPGDDFGRRALLDLTASDAAAAAIQAEVDRGLALLAGGDVDGALAIARRLYGEAPTRPVYLLAAECWLRQGKTDDAVAAFGRALALLFDDALCVRVGTALWDDGRWEDAIEAVAAQLRRLADAAAAPESGRWLDARRGDAAVEARRAGFAALAATRDGEPDRLPVAEREFRRAVRHRPADPRGHLGLAETYERLGDAELARAGYARVLDLARADDSEPARALAAAADAGLDRVGR